MIKQLLSLDPDQRGTCADHLRNAAFPAFFPNMHEFLAQAQSSSRQQSSTLSTHQSSHSLPISKLPAIVEARARPDPVLRTDADALLEHFYQDWSQCVAFFERAPKVEDGAEEVPIPASQVSCIQFT